MTEPLPKNKTNGGSLAVAFAVGATIGAIAGAIAGVLTAPKSGAETRKELEQKGKAALKKAKEQGEKLKKAAPESILPTEEKVIAEVKVCPKKPEAKETAEEE